VSAAHVSASACAVFSEVCLQLPYIEQIDAGEEREHTKTCLRTWVEFAIKFACLYTRQDSTAFGREAWNCCLVSIVYTSMHALLIGLGGTRVVPALPYDPGEQGDPLHAEAPAETA
jgi:hypothetical protein